MCKAKILLLVLSCVCVYAASQGKTGRDFSFSDVSGVEKLQLLYDVAMEIVPVQPQRADSIAQEMLKRAGATQTRYKGLAYYVRGEAGYYLERYDRALENYKRAEVYLEDARDSALLAGNCSNIGLMHYYKADYKAALVYFERSLELEQQLQDSVGMAKCFQNIGLIFGHWGKFEMQSLYYARALEMYKTIGDDTSIADMALNLGVALVYQGKLHEGFENYKEALRVYEEKGDSNRIASIKTNIGYYYTKVGDYGKALVNFNEAIDMFNAIDAKNGLIQAYTGLGDLFVAKGKKTAAVEMYKMCEEINQEVGLLETQSENLFSLYETYKEMGDYENALRVYEQTENLKDSIFGLNELDKILELEKKYELQKSQNKVNELTAQNRLYAIFFLVIAFVLVCGGVFMFFYSRDRGMKEKQRLLSLEQKVLRTQMNPHFIFNSLSAIQCYVLENKTMDAVDFLADFASLMRMVLHYSKEEYISMEQEREILDFYIDLQNKRFGDKVKYQIVIDEKLAHAKVKIPPMLAQPFIENSFEHGELYKKEDGEIVVKFDKKGKNLSYQIEDNGIGIAAKMKESNSPTTKKHKSLALKITKERLKLINNGNTGNRVNLKIEDRSKYGTNGTRVEFTIPLEEMN